MITSPSFYQLSYPDLYVDNEKLHHKYRTIKTAVAEEREREREREKKTLRLQQVPRHGSFLYLYSSSSPPPALLSLPKYSLVDKSKEGHASRSQVDIDGEKLHASLGLYWVLFHLARCLVPLLGFLVSLFCCFLLQHLN